MLKLKFLFLILIIFYTNITFSQTSASQNYSALLISSPSGCTDEALQNIIDAVNKYRASDSKTWKPVIQPEFTLSGADPQVKGIITIPVSEQLMKAAKETARKFTDGTYPEMDHVINGQAATMRAIKSGWVPSFNKLFTADVIPPFTMVQENFFMGTTGHYLWNDVVEGWKTSPGHNATMLSSGAVSIGCGCSDSPVTSDGTKNTYWVLLIETEAAISESDELMNKLFSEGTLYRVKSDMKNKDFTNYKASEYFEFIDSGIKKIKDY